ncbi:interleukin-17 receptor E-like protein isoform X2 [Eucyclogobius newberryi]|uniref:interleukin-17 receptor E-like protein isoform X2 n=1 Tax=Eucyclogobius newberryi TaxID=166745 RepID=UPI003B5C1D5C
MHLRIQTRLQIRDSLHGVSICTSSPGLFPNCRIISFSKDSRKRLSGSLVDLEDDCIKLSLSQQVQITVETYPHYCGTDWTQVYTAPGCANKDLQNNVADCIRKLLYRVNPMEKSVTINVTEMREGHNYNLRLCHAKGYTCASTGPLTVIKKEDTIKSTTLSYSRLVPCLCIEGWSAVLDAHRVRVCPFRQHVEELWTGITFDPIEATLSWQPSCPVTARITLCQKQKYGDCIDLPHTSHNVTRQKVKYTDVESHPQLCMKFSMNSEDWIRCPFDDRRFTAWEMSRHPEGAVLLSSPGPGIFSVESCEVESVVPPRACQFTQNYTVKVEKLASVKVPLPTELCHRAFCLQVRRQDVRYSTTLVHCFDPILQTDLITSVNPTWIIVPAGVLLALVILTSLMLYIWLTVHQRRTQTQGIGLCSYEKQKDCARECVVAALHCKSTPLEGIFVNSPQNRNNEKANLLSD